jgi:hypothetical protein
MRAVTLAPPHAILFVFDPSNKRVQVPEYVAGELIAVNSTAVSVGTQAEVDGETTVTLGSRNEALDLSGFEKVFEGKVETPGRRLAVVTSERHTILEAEVGGTESKIAVWADDGRSPGHIIVLTR